MDQVFTIDADAAGARLDRFLAGALGLSRAAVRALLPGVTVDAHPAAAGQTLVAGQVVAVPGDALAALTLPVADADVGLRVIGQGPGWITVDKPAGVAVHPLQPGERGTLLNAVVTRWPGVVGVGEGGLRSGVVHRLDVTTSGAVVFALEQGAWQRWRAAFAEHRVDKRYVALVAGVAEVDGVAGGVAGAGWREQVMWLRVARHRPARVEVVEPGRGWRCALAWRALATCRPTREGGAGGASLVEVALETGFLHQVRVMLAAVGHPLLGDGRYGGPTDAAPRPILHAATLTVDAGIVQDEPVHVASDPPGDFRELMHRLGIEA